ncbi:MAG: GGDEF domain-containing protein [Aquabacterium sp.]|nr:GGDEF domain-containing protein [Aquabacterium sp.]
MRQLLERFIISSTPSWRVLLAIFAATPVFLVVVLGHWLAFRIPEIKSALNMGLMWALDGVFLLAVAVNITVGLWLWPHRAQPHPVPVAVLFVIFAIGLSYACVTILGGSYTSLTNVTLLSVLAIGLLLFDLRPMVQAFLCVLGIILVADVGVGLGWWPYAPALTERVMLGDAPVWWFHEWRQFMFVAGYTICMSILLLLFDRLEVMMADLHRLSYTDGLTGLANRRHFMSVLSNEAARQARTGQPMSVVLIDADQFKNINDQHGHAMGDEVLRAIGRVLMACVRTPTDLASRIGGEEFALVLPDTTQEKAQAVCERLRQQLAQQQFGEPGARFQATVSMGVVQGAGLSPAQMLQQADRALYQAKATGRDRVCVAEQAAAAS